MAAKRLPAGDGEQDFGFLSSDTDADRTDGEDAEIRAETSETPIAQAAIPASDDSQLSVTNVTPDTANPGFTSNSACAPSTGDSLQPTCPASAPSFAVPPALSTDHVSRKLFVGVAGYALAVTLFFLALLLTGRMSLSENHALESLPDLRPLAPNEFRKVPDGAALPDGHVLGLGESRRFGDVVVTPVRVTKEPLQFQGFLSGKIEKKLTTAPVLKLWLTFENVAEDYAFPPFDVGLMSNRTPSDSKDAATLANTFLMIGIPSGDSATTRRLNFLHTMDNNFVIVGQESAKILEPGESFTTFIADRDEADDVEIEDSTPCVWRVQFRKGVNVSSGNGVTTLIDVEFSGADISASG